MFDRTKVQNLMAITKAYTVPHGNRTLSDHLLRCYDLAVHAGMSETVCYAVGAHSIYGTDSFKTVITTDRKLVASYIGEEAERLVYLFSIAKRTPGWETKGVFTNRLTDSVMDVGTKVFTQLAQIEQINLLEQNYASKQQTKQVQKSTGIASKLSNQPAKTNNAKAIARTGCCGRGGY